MTNERAIEILNPQHREHYDNIEVVNEACRMGMKALEKQIPKEPIDKDYSDARCPVCNNLVVAFELISQAGCYPHYCSHCGQAIDWGESD